MAAAIIKLILRSLLQKIVKYNLGIHLLYQKLLQVSVIRGSMKEFITV